MTPDHALQSGYNQITKGYSKMTEKQIPAEWLEWTEYVPRSYAKKVFGVTTIQGVVHVLSELEKESVFVEQINMNPEEGGQPRWFLKRDDLIEAWKHRNKD